MLSLEWMDHQESKQGWRCRMKAGDWCFALSLVSQQCTAATFPFLFSSCLTHVGHFSRFTPGWRSRVLFDWGFCRFVFSWKGKKAQGQQSTVWLTWVPLLLFFSRPRLFILVICLRFPEINLINRGPHYMSGLYTWYFVWLLFPLATNLLSRGIA